MSFSVFSLSTSKRECSPEARDGCGGGVALYQVGQTGPVHYVTSPAHCDQSAQATIRQDQGKVIRDERTLSTRARVDPGTGGRQLLSTPGGQTVDCTVTIQWAGPGQGTPLSLSLFLSVS